MHIHNKVMTIVLNFIIMMCNFQNVGQKNLKSALLKKHDFSKFNLKEIFS